MKSPFPGMDPFIEPSPYWGDFHASLIALIQNRLADTAPDRYFVRTNVRSYIETVASDGREAHPFLPDVSVSGGQPAGKRPRKKGGAAVAAPVAEDAPVLLRPFIPAEAREGFVEIHEAREGQPRLVTAIEILSPSNKVVGSDGYKAYLRKRRSTMLGGVHFVELDLLRGGTRMPMIDPWPESPYVLMVARAGRSRSQVWRAHSVRPLPKLPIPLLEPDPDLEIDLQPMADLIYRRNRYAASLDYGAPLDPPLSADEAAALAAGLKARAR